MPTTSYAVLGLLAIGPMSRYELWQKAEMSIANFWTIAKSQVYSELERLEKLGYVSGKEVKQKAKPDKTTFTLTRQGEKALSEWLSTPDIESDRIRSAFMVKLFFGAAMSGDVTAKLIEDYKGRAAANVESLRQVVGMIDGEELRYMRACASLGLRLNEAMVRWADETLASLQPARSKAKKTGGNR